MPRYSIILPVRNGGHYVKECVNSILSQSLPDFHLQVLDNCSSDGTVEWLNTLKDDRIKIYPADRPLSIEENWGRITTIAKNEFITLIGHDDILDKNYLSVMDRLINKHPAASLYQAHFRYIDSAGNTIRLCKPMDEVQSAPEFLGLFLASGIDNMGTGYMMRSSDYDAVEGIPPYPNLLFADFELWIELTRKSYKATAFDECFAFRIHQSMTTTSSDIKFHNALGQFVNYLKSIAEKDARFKEVTERYAISYLQLYCQGLAHRLLRTSMRNRQNKRVADLVEQCKEYANILVPGNNFDPYRNLSIRQARQIDSNAFTRALFRLFKKIYKKPIYLA